MDPITTPAAPKIVRDPVPEVSNIFFNAVSGLQSSIGGLEDANFDIANNPIQADSEVTPFTAFVGTASNKVKVQDGTVNGLSSSLSEQTISGNTNVFLEVTVNSSGTVTAVDLNLDAGTPSDTTTEAYVKVSSITFSGGAITGITNFLSGSLGHAYAGQTTHIFFRL
jgi:hypothetical protein